MKIRSKIMLPLGVTAVVMIMLLYAVSILIVERSLLRLEEENLKFRLTQLSTEFDVEAVNLDTVNRDWGSWDDTYAFVDSSFPEKYISENISASVFKYLRLNMFVIFDKSNAVVYSYFVEPENNKKLWTEDNIKQLLAKLQKFPELKNEHDAKVGFMLLGATPILISGRQILKNDFSGPSKGHLCMGRIFDERVISAYEDKYGIKIKLTAADISTSSEESFKVLYHDKNLISASLIINDIWGQPSISLEIEQARTIYKTGWHALKSYALIIALITFVFAGLMIFFMEKLILKRFWLIFQVINNIIETKSFDKRMDINGKDEFATLAANINHLLVSLSAFEADKTDRQLADLANRVLSGSLIFVHNNLVYHNDEQARINGPIRSNLSFANYLTLYVHPFDRHVLTDLFQKAESGHESSKQSVIIRCFKFAGAYQGEPSQKWVEATAHLFEYKSDSAVLLNMVDISKTKHLEQILLSREKMTSLGHVAAGIAHEIRNPLMGIGLTLDNIYEYFDGCQNLPQLAEMLEQAREAALNIRLVLERVLDFARASDLSLSRIDITVPVGTAIKLSRAVAKKNNVNIEVHSSDDLPLIMGDAQMLVEVFVNLISNSIQAMDGQLAEKKIAVHIYKADQGIEIRLMDSGPGIAPKDMPNLFEPFFTTKDDGSGLGLSICRRIITDHGGTIEMDFSVLDGAAFLIFLPMSDEMEK